MVFVAVPPPAACRRPPPPARQRLTRSSLGRCHAAGVGEAVWLCRRVSATHSGRLFVVCDILRLAAPLYYFGRALGRGCWRVRLFCRSPPPPRPPISSASARSSLKRRGRSDVCYRQLFDLTYLSIYNSLIINELNKKKANAFFLLLF